MRLQLLLLLPFFLTACISDAVDYDDNPDKKTIWTEKRDVHSGGDWRQERLKKQGREDNSADGGRQFGW